MPLFSHSKIDCECQGCKRIINIGYHNYNKNIKNGGIFYCKNCRIIKIENTNIKKYGVKTTFLEKNTMVKIKETMLKKFGVEKASQSKELMCKSAKTFKKTYKEHKEEIIQKKIKTNLIKYGCENPLSLNEIKEKTKKTFLEKYGVENCSQNEKIKEKIKKTCLEKYGVEHYSKTDESKKHVKDLNLDYKKIQEKMKKTSLDRYGVEYPAQNIDIFNKTQKSQFKIKYYKNIKYQGNYELDFLILCDKLNLLKDITRMKSIKYFYKEKIRYYHPDFYFKKLNLIIEIKSNYYYDLYLEKNLKKEKSCIEQKYDFMFIINKNYDKFLEKINPII